VKRWLMPLIAVLLFIPVTLVLGSQASAITNGTVVPASQYPAMVSVMQLDHGKPAAHVCGGTLVSPRFVLTAKHCGGRGTEYNIGVVAGKDAPLAADPVWTVSRIFENTSLDAELIELKSSVSSPIAELAPGTTSVGTTGAMLGYCGNVDCSQDRDNPPLNLRLANVKVQPKPKVYCSSGYCTNDTQLALKSSDGTPKAAVKGDSGGPFYDTSGGKRLLAGVLVTSDKESTTVALRVSKLSSWIKKTTAVPPVASIPDAPRELTLSSSNGTLMASWLPPYNDGGAAVQGYSIFLSTSSSDGVPVQLPPTATSYTFSNLVPGEPYTVHLSAFNSVGPSVEAVGSLTLNGGTGVVASSVSVFAGTGTPTPGVNGGNGGPATSATFNSPFGVVADAAGNVYISDSGNAVIRKVDPHGIVTAYAGTGVRGHSGDGGPAVNAQLGPSVFGLGIDAQGNIFVADTTYIRKIDANGIITTIGGSGATPTSGAPVPPDGTPALNVPMSPYALTADAAGNVYFSDLYAGYVRKITTDGLIQTVAGNGAFGSQNTGDGGPALDAQVGTPFGLLADNAGNLYLSDLTQVRVVNAAGIITSVAGTGASGDTGDGGPATEATLKSPYGLAKDTAGNLFISDFASKKIRVVSASGAISTLAAYGTGDGSDPLQGLDASPIQLALSPDQSTLYVTMLAEVQAVHLVARS
jgi:Trypsin/Fibronectin type III domain